MALRIAQVTLINGVQNIIKAFPTGIKAYLIGNESGFTCNIKLENGDEKTLYPGTVDYFPVTSMFSGVIFVNPSINISTAILYPAATLWVDAVAPDDDTSSSSYPMQLSRPMTAGSPSPQKGFSANVLFTIAAAPTARYMLNLFNKAAIGSGIIATIFSVQVKQSGTGDVTSNLSVRTDGIDNNFGGGANIITHNIGGIGSNMHATFANNTAIPAQNNFIGTTFLDNDLYDWAAPPDAFYLNPGQNITIDVQNPIPNSLIFTMFKWSE